MVPRHGFITVGVRSRPAVPVPKGLKQTKQKWPAQSYATMICANGQRAIRSAKETILDLPGRQLDDGCGTVLGRSRSRS